MTTKAPDWVPATSQSEVSFGTWTVMRHRTGLVSIACRGQQQRIAKHEGFSPMTHFSEFIDVLQHTGRNRLTHNVYKIKSEMSIAAALYACLHLQIITVRAAGPDRA